MSEYFLKVFSLEGRKVLYILSAIKHKISWYWCRVNVPSRVNVDIDLMWYNHVFMFIYYWKRCTCGKLCTS